MEPQAFYNSKVKSFLIFVAGVLMLIAFLSVFIDSSIVSDSFELLHNPLYVKILCALGMILSITIMLLNFRKAFSTAPALIISAQGIDINPREEQLLRWQDIIALELSQKSGQHNIIIVLKNPEQFMAQSKDKWQRMTQEMNLKLYSTPVVINVDILGISAEVLFDLMEAKWQSVRGGVRYSVEV